MREGTSEWLSRCSAAQLKTLLAQASAPSRAITLPALAANPAVWRAKLGEMTQCDKESAEMLLAMICESRTSPAALTAVKNRAKRLAANARTEVARAAAMLLYHAAIASAYAFHGRAISSRAIGSYVALYDDLAAVLRTDPVGALFEKAVARATHELPVLKSGR